MNILILTAKFGMGHYMASMSLKQELENKNINVEVVDFFEIIFPNTKNLIYNSFNILVSKFSFIYNFFYKFSANTNKAPFKNIIRKRIDELIESKNINTIISTFPVCSKYMSSYKKVNPNIKLYTYITDVDVNKEWVTENTDSYFVASYETKEQLLNYNISPHKIKVVGIPIKEEFKDENVKKTPNEVLVMGGGLGLISNIENTLNSLIKNKDIHITFLAGKNQKLFNKYYRKYENLTVIGYTNEVHKYMKRAELIITKPGGITLFEAIHSKTPIYAIYPFLSQEIGNAKFIENNEIGRVVWDKEENITQDILKLLKEKIKLEDMRKNMQDIKNHLEKTTVIDCMEGRA